MKQLSTTKPLLPQSINAVYLMLLTVVTLWGINVVMIKYLIGFFSPLALAAIRMTIAATFLLPVVLLRDGKPFIPRKAWLPLFGVSLFSIYLHQLTLAWGLTAASGTHTALILGLSPLFTTLLASYVAKESLNCQKLSSIALGFCAIALIISGNHFATSAAILGDGIITVSMLTAVIGYMFIKKATTVIPILTLTAYSHLIASIGLILTAVLVESNWIQTTRLDFQPIAILLFSGWINTGLGALCWNTGIHRIGASTTSLFLNGVPVAGMFASSLFLHEQLGWQHYLALGLVLVSVRLGTGMPLSQQQPRGENSAGL
jgi:drug/metabolite transporter (DMT)-like permease